MRERVLITGGAGFIGSALAKVLARDGQAVFIADCLHAQVHPSQALPVDFPADVTFLPFDVTAGNDWVPLLNYVRPARIVHLAAETGTGQSLTEASRHAHVNVVGTAALTDALSRSQARPATLVLASSRAVYGDGAWLDSRQQVFYPKRRSADQLRQGHWDPLDADGKPGAALPHRAGITHPMPVSVYGATKLAQEHMLAAWCTAFDCGLTVLRFQNVYGPGQALHNSYTGILSLFARLALQKSRIPIFEDGNIVRDFVFVDDAVEAICQALSKALSGIHTFDVGSGEAQTVADVAAKLATQCGAPEPSVTGEFRHGDVRSAFCDISATRSVLDFRPATSLDEGLAQLTHWTSSTLAQGREQHASR